MYLLIFLLINIGIACEINWQKNFALAVDAKENEFFPYLQKRAREIQPVISGNGCQKTADSKKYLMIAFAPQNLEFTDRIDFYDINDSYRESKCQIKNSPFKTNLTFEERKKNLKEKWHALRSCFKVIIQEKNSKSIQYPEIQPGCKITRINESSISFNGGYCFIQPKSDNDFVFSIDSNNECLDYRGLSYNSIRAVDFLTTLNFYIAGDASGSSIDLTMLKSLPLRLSTSPFEKLVLSSSSYGSKTPQFNGNFLVPDIHPGLPEISAISDTKVHIRFPLWVDNNCAEKCTENYCQNTCSYAHPISGLIELTEIGSDGKKSPIAQWYQGGVAQPKFQGEIAGQVNRIEREQINVGKKYSIHIDFNDPKYDFEQYKNMINKRLKNVFPSLGRIDRNGIPSIPGISEIENFGEVPFISDLPQLDFNKKIKEEFDSSLEGLSNYLGFRYWPPYYESICSDTYCTDISDKYINIRLDFKIKKYDEETMKYDLEILEIARNSKILPSYKTKNSQLPSIECKI